MGAKWGLPWGEPVMYDLARWHRKVHRMRRGFDDLDEFCAFLEYALDSVRGARRLVGAFPGGKDRVDVREVAEAISRAVGVAGLGPIGTFTDYKSAFISRSDDPHTVGQLGK